MLTYITKYHWHNSSVTTQKRRLRIHSSKGFFSGMFKSPTGKTLSLWMYLNLKVVCIAEEDSDCDCMGGVMGSGVVLAGSVTSGN